MNKLMIAIVLSTLVGVPLSPAAADNYTAQTIINGNVGAGAQGALSINMTSGDSNLQSNTRAIAINPTGNAMAEASANQTINGGSVSAPDSATTRINGTAFTNVTGVIGINQAAGAANRQSNSLAIAIGAGTEVSANTLAAQNVSDPPPAIVPATGQQRETTVASSAFNDARGIVQVNQSSGVANATNNSFSLRVHLGAQ